MAYVRFETLNLMTSTLGLVLFGLGIDFGIHFYARYTEERRIGKSVIDAVETTFVSTRTGNRNWCFFNCGCTLYIGGCRFQRV